MNGDTLKYMKTWNIANANNDTLGDCYISIVQSQHDFRILKNKKCFKNEFEIYVGGRNHKSKINDNVGGDDDS